MIDLSTNIEEIPRIGTAYHKKLKKFGIKTVQDLLFYFPSRYDDFSDIIPINKVKVGYNVCVQGKVLSIESARTFKKFMSITEVIIEDETGTIKALWFNQPYLAKTLKEDDYICLAGKVSLGKEGIYLNNPAYERMGEFTENNQLTHTGRIVPVYAETKGLTSRWLRFIIKPLLSAFYNQIPEILPEEILKKYKFLPIKKAIWQVHFPDSFEYADAAKSRFAFEELFLLQLHVLKERAKLLQKQAPQCPMNTELMKEFTGSLPFQLTDSQKQCSWQILKDLEKSVPMSRLLEGDVGSGKTVVAAMAALNVVKGGHPAFAQASAGKQVAFMAPTEILAQQHFKTVTELLKNFNVKIGYLTGKGSFMYKNAKVVEMKKKDLLLELEFGQIDILIGTHSLIQKNVTFSKLALVILDEQHRFGVSQRMALVRGSAQITQEMRIPHLLSMTATPIPRTLALTVYGDLDLSLIKEMPKNRKKVKTLIVGQKDRKAAYEFIHKEAKEGKGIFVICPKIGSDEIIQDTAKSQAFGSFLPQNYDLGILKMPEIKAVKQEYEKLSKEIFPDLRITMMYGKMKPKEKEVIMQDFKKGEIDILVSTSVVEVGVDVPRATVMMIEGAERFGLAQLHQFRGRVGRSDMQSYCFLFTTEQNQQNRERLKAMEKLNSGFELAQKDLEIRGPGQIYGTQQWGLPDMAMQNLSNIFLIEKTRQAAKEILEKDPALLSYPLLKERLKNFEQRIHFE